MGGSCIATPLRPATIGTTSGMFNATLQAGYFILPLRARSPRRRPHVRVRRCRRQSESFRVPPLAWHPRAPYRTPWSHPMVRTRTSSAPWPAEHRLLGMSPTIGLLRGSEPGRCQLRSTRVLETRMCASKRLAQYPSTQRTIDPPGLIPPAPAGLVHSAPRAEPHANISTSPPA